MIKLTIDCDPCDWEWSCIKRAFIVFTIKQLQLMVQSRPKTYPDPKDWLPALLIHNACTLLINGMCLGK